MNKNMSQYQAASPDQIKEAMDIAISQVVRDLDRFTDHFKVNGTTHNFYEPAENKTWTSGFWTGQICLAYELSSDTKEKERLKATILKQVDSFLYRIDKQIDTNHHDMGFLYSLSCVAAYKLFKSEKAKEAAIKAAEHLITRFQPKGGFIQAWGNVGADDNYRLIIDCLLNLPLLYWASQVSGQEKFAEIAKTHINTALKVVMREDFSTYHTYYFDKNTGHPLYGETLQGYSDDSAWARGQAWGIYGAALSYRYTQNPDYIDKFYKMADFFIDHLPKDLVPFWDFTFTDGSTEPRDSSAAAIAVCGMLEMSKYLEGENAEKYKGLALKILHSLIENYSVKDYQVSNGQLLHGVYARSTQHNPCRDRNVDECNVWGDYFYMEALVRMLKDWDLYW